MRVFTCDSARAFRGCGIKHERSLAVLPVKHIVKDCSRRMNSGFSFAPKLARLAARTDRGVQLHREAWPINAHYWLDTRYAPRVLHFSAFIGYCGWLYIYIYIYNYICVCVCDKTILKSDKSVKYLSCD